MPVHDAQPPLPQYVALLLKELPFARPTTVLDVGANPINDCPYAPLLAAGGCNVIGFEPQTEAFDQLQQSKGPNETYHNSAVGDGRTHTLHIYESSGFTSLFRPHMPAARLLGNRRWARVRERVPLETVALDAVPDLGAFDLLKIDIQGGETLVFDNAIRVMSEAVAVIVELRYMQLYEGEPMLGGVDNSLRRQGFQLHKFLFNKSKSLPHSQIARLHRRRTADQLIDGDAVYLRHPGKIEAYTDDQLMHLALLASSVFQSHSVALFALDELISRGCISEDLPERYVDALPEAFKAEPREEAVSAAAANATGAEAATEASGTSKSNSTKKQASA